MIRISKDGKTLVSIESWEGLTERPGFRKVVEAQEGDLDDIIGYYDLRPLGQCGLKGCRHWHYRGLLVVLKDGTETNVGNVCGRRHFGVAWTDMKDRLIVALNAQRHREHITTTQALVPSLIDRLKRLREGKLQAAECYEKMHSRMTRLFDDDTAKALRLMAKTGDGKVTREIKVSREERQLTVGKLERDYRQEVVYIIPGIKGATSYLKLAPRRFADLIQELHEFRQLDADTLCDKELKAHHRWANRIESRISDLEDVLTDCQRFLVRTNIQEINRLKPLLREVLRKVA